MTNANNPDPFETLALPRRFDLSRDQIEQAYLQRVAAIHPDASQDTGDDAIQYLNNARATLRNPEQRAIALLRLLGGPSESDDRSLPDGFLLEMMQTRETIERETADADPHAIEKWEAWADERRDGHVARVRELFQRAPESNDPTLLAQIRLELNAWRYIERLIEQLDPGYKPLP